MGRFGVVPPIDLTPRFTEPLSTDRWRDYVTLHRWVVSSPQCIEPYIHDYLRGEKGEKSPNHDPLDWGAWIAWRRENPHLANFLWLCFGLAMAWLLALTLGMLALDYVFYGLPPIAGVSGLIVYVLSLILFALLAVPVVAVDRFDRLCTVILPAVTMFATFTLAFNLTTREVLAQAGWSLFGLHGLVMGSIFGFCYSILRVPLYRYWCRQLSPAWTRLGQVLRPMEVGLALGSTALPLLILLPDFLQFLPPRRPVEQIWMALAFVVAPVSFLVISLRPLQYIRAYGQLPCRPDAAEPEGPGQAIQARQIPRVTPLPLLETCLRRWLHIDWKQAIQRAEQLWRYTGQHAAVVQAVRHALQKQEGGQQMENVLVLAQTPPWDLQDFLRWPFWPRWSLEQALAEILRPGGDEGAGQGSPSQAERRRLRRIWLRRRRHPDMPRWQRLPLVETYEKAIGGFWYLMAGYPHDAQQAFQDVPCDFAREMANLCRALDQILDGNDIRSQEPIALPDTPVRPRRKQAWELVRQFEQVLRLAWLYPRCGENIREDIRQRVTNGLDKIQATLTSAAADGPFLERRVLQIARDELGWELASWFERPPQSSPPRPFPSPYYLRGPLPRREQLVGRRRELDRIRQAWGDGPLYPLLLWGPPLVGKTSLLDHAPIALELPIQLVALKLKTLPPNPTEEQLIMAVCERMAPVAESSPPDPRRIARAPRESLHQMVNEACNTLGQGRLVLVLDDFDVLGASPSHRFRVRPFLETLEYIRRHQPAFGVAAITTSPPDQFLATWASSTWASPFSRLETVAVEVGYLAEGDSRRLLQQPNPRLPLIYAQETLKAIHRCTGGHPYLLQLCGHAVVTQYNQAHRDSSRSQDAPERSPFITAALLESATKLPEYRTGREIFCEAYRPYLQRLGEEQRAMLQELAKGPKGGIAQQEFQQAIQGQFPELAETEREALWQELTELKLVQTRQDDDETRVALAIPLLSHCL